MEIFNTAQVFLSLQQDEKSDITLRRLTESSISIYAAELKPGKKLPAHYHHTGGEIYQVVSGEGFMETGLMESGQGDGTSVAWNASFPIKAGDVFEVPPAMVHKLSNPGIEALHLIFFTPPSHLGEDRVFL
jgi:mannose-6-phosphate isomerase-like protein (cupin superfamily)